MKSIIYRLFLVVAAIFAAVPDACALSPSGTLPVLHINTAGGAPIESKETYLDATYWLETNGVSDMGADLGSEASPLALQIRGRGNYTWSGFDKKPYRLKLGKKAAMLGMDSNKHWALLAHADDNRGFLRNALGFELSRLVGMAWTPGSKPCEVVLNGDYIGLYFLTETVRVDKKRVNVIDGDSEVEDWLADNPGKPWTDYPFTPLDNTGGWLVEIDNYDDADQIKVPTLQQEGQVIRVTYDTPSDYITDAQKSWLKSQFETMDRLICNREDWTGYVDTYAAAQFFIVNQLVGNYESYHGSCKMYRQRGDGQKWMFGPVWDFGSAFQNIDAMKRWIWQSDYLQHWIQDMYRSDAFRTEVKAVYKELMDGRYSELVPYAESFVELIRSAAARDYERWPQYGNNDIDLDLKVVKSMLDASVTFCNTQFGYEPPVDYSKVRIYLRGFGGWDLNPAYCFTYTGQGAIFTLKVRDLTGPFKLSGSDWSVYDMGYGPKSADNPVFPLNTPTVLMRGGADIQLDRTVPEATLVLDYETSTLTVSTEGAVTDIDAESADIIPVYYNLQGQRIDAPASGSPCIIVRGSTVSKVIRN